MTFSYSAEYENVSKLYFWVFCNSKPYNTKIYPHSLLWLGNSLKMEIRDLLSLSREIWGDEKLSLAQIIVRMGKVFGDICRWERNGKKNQATHTDAEIKKELGNIIFSTIRWCDDLGYSPEECVNLAIECQKKFVVENKE